MYYQFHKLQRSHRSQQQNFDDTIKCVIYKDSTHTLVRSLFFFRGVYQGVQHNSNCLMVQWSKLVLYIVKVVNLWIAESISIFSLWKWVTFLTLICFSICAVNFGRTRGTGLMTCKCASTFPYCCVDDWIKELPVPEDRLEGHLFTSLRE